MWWQICVDTASYHQVYMCCVQTWWKCRSCEYGFVIRVLILLLFIYYLTGIDECQATVQKVITSQKSKKSKRMSAYDWYKFSWNGMHKLVQVRNRCRNVWIMLLSYAYIIVSGPFLFSGFNPTSAFPHFMLSTTIYRCWLNKVLRVQTVSLPGSVAAGWSQATGRKGNGPGSH